VDIAIFFMVIYTEDGFTKRIPAYPSSAGSLYLLHEILSLGIKHPKNKKTGPAHKNRAILLILRL